MGLKSERERGVLERVWSYNIKWEHLRGSTRKILSEQEVKEQTMWKYEDCYCSSQRNEPPQGTRGGWRSGGWHGRRGVWKTEGGRGNQKVSQRGKRRAGKWYRGVVSHFWGSWVLAAGAVGQQNKGEEQSMIWWSHRGPRIMTQFMVFTWAEFCSNLGITNILFPKSKRNAIILGVFISPPSFLFNSSCAVGLFLVSSLLCKPAW